MTHQFDHHLVLEVYPQFGQWLVLTSDVTTVLDGERPSTTCTRVRVWATWCMQDERVHAPRDEPSCSNHWNKIDTLSRPRFQSPSFLLRGFEPLINARLPMVPLQTFMEHSTIIGIADIPTELLLEIGAYVTLVDSHHRSLCFLAQTCRRFYSLFNPQVMGHIADCIFKRCVTTISKSNGREYPSGGRVHPRDLLKRRLKSMYIPCKRGYTSDDIRCYRSLIFHAHHIGSVTVDLRYGNLNSRALARLLNSCIQRPGIELNITEASILSSWGSQYVDGPFVFTLEKADEQQPSAMLQDKKGWFKTTIIDNIKHLLSRGTLSSHSMSFNATPRLTIVPRRYHALPFPRSPPQLTAFGITGGVLFSAIMYPWTRHILNTAPLIRLSITRVRLSTPEWSQILASISIPTLTHLALGSVTISFLDLLAFLARHPRLQTLDLSNNTTPLGPTFFPSSLSQSTFLPDLTLIIAASSYIQIFVRQRRRGYCPKLTTFRHVPNHD